MVYMVTVLLLDFYQTTYECSKVRLKKDFFFFIFFFPFFKHRHQCKRSNQSDSTQQSKSLIFFAEQGFKAMNILYCCLRT